MKSVDILGDNRFDKFTKTREGSRAIIIKDGKILLTHEMKSEWWLIPGGGLEEGENSKQCCVREVEEETGYIVRPVEQFLVINEYYEEYRYVSYYFVCEVVGTGTMKPTEEEKLRGIMPVWCSINDAMDIYSKHQSYAATSEEKRGAYLREYTALCEYMKFCKKKKKPNKKVIKAVIVALVIIGLFIGLMAYLMRDVGIKHYDDLTLFQEQSHTLIYVPDGAEDIRMVVDNSIFVKTFFCSYVLDDNELNELIEKNIQEKYTKSKPDGDVEIVFDKYYGIKVKEIDDVDAQYGLDDFPHSLAFDSVIDDSIEDYIVIYYYPTNSGNRSSALLYNKETNRVLEYYNSQIR